MNLLNLLLLNLLTFARFYKAKNIITTYALRDYKAHPCFASKLSKSKLSKLLFFMFQGGFKL